VARIDSKHCVVCGSDISKDDWAEPTELADKRVDKATEELRDAKHDLSESRHNLDEAERRYQAHFVAIQELNTKLIERSARIDSLVTRLPPAEAALQSSTR
jgi:chromosome segregation ATPase